MSKTVSIPFIISEKFENCSDIKSCSFDNGLCDWTASDQSNLAVDVSGNKFLETKPSSQDSDETIEVMHSVINDSYCGLSFLYKTTDNVDLRVSVDGLGVLWSTAVVEELAAIVQKNASLEWQEVSLYIDVLAVEMMVGRRLVMEGVGLSSDAAVSIDNVTLHPCVDCQAKGII